MVHSLSLCFVMCVFILCAKCRASQVVLNKDPNDTVIFPYRMTVLSEDRSIVKYTEGIEMNLCDLVWHEQNSMFATTPNGTYLYNGFEDITVAKLSEEYVDLLGLDRGSIVDDWENMRRESKLIIDEDNVKPIDKEHCWDQFMNVYVPAKYNELKNRGPGQATPRSTGVFGTTSVCTCVANRCINTAVDSCKSEIE